MQEELDTLRVEIAQNAATVYELRVKLEQEREGEIGKRATVVTWEGRKEMFYLTTHSTHFIYG